MTKLIIIRYLLLRLVRKFSTFSIGSYFPGEVIMGNP